MIIGFLETLHKNFIVRCGCMVFMVANKYFTFQYICFTSSKKNRAMDFFTSQLNKTTDNSNNIFKQKLIFKICSSSIDIALPVKLDTT